MVGREQMRGAGLGTALGTALCALASAALAEAPAGCADGRRIGTMLTGEWPTGPVRSAYLDDLDNATSGADRMVVLHCPTGRYVEVTGFRPAVVWNDILDQDPLSPEERALHDRIAAVTHAAVDGPERVTLGELADRYRALGLAAAERRDFGPTCLCD